MASRYIVAPGHFFNYPNERDDKIIKARGGRSQMPKSELADIKFKSVSEGQDCSDMPKEALELYVSRGWVIDTEAGKELGTKVDDIKIVGNFVDDSGVK